MKSKYKNKICLVSDKRGKKDKYINQLPFLYTPFSKIIKHSKIDL
jgi:hypothetical protein